MAGIDVTGAAFGTAFTMLFEKQFLRYEFWLLSSLSSLIDSGGRGDTGDTGISFRSRSIL